MQLQQHIPASLIATVRKSRSTGDLVTLVEDLPPPVGLSKGMEEVKILLHLKLTKCTNLLLIFCYRLCLVSWSHAMHSGYMLPRKRYNASW